jgi:ABC-type sulfate transport system permease component
MNMVQIAMILAIIHVIVSLVMMIQKPAFGGIQALLDEEHISGINTSWLISFIVCVIIVILLMS